MAVSLREITKDNFDACTELSVRKDQQFVTSNSFSIAESKIFPFWIIKAIYYEEDIVGFIMYTKNYEEGELHLRRFMVDEKYQGKGYGKETLELLKEIALKDENIKIMKLSTNPKNKNGIRIYEKFGFVNTKTIEEDEEVFVLKLRK